jgi:hypothetical protein
MGYINYYTPNNQTTFPDDAINDENLITIDRWALVVYTILFFAYQIGTIIWMFVVPWGKRRMMFRKDWENRLQLESRYSQRRGTHTGVLSGDKKTKAETQNATVVSNIDL